MIGFTFVDTDHRWVDFSWTFDIAISFSSQSCRFWLGWEK